MITLLSLGLIIKVGSPLLVPANYPILLESELEIVNNCNFQSMRAELMLIFLEKTM